MAMHVVLKPGDLAPWFNQRAISNDRFGFDAVAGRYIVLCFFATATDAHAQAALSAVLARPDLFNDRKTSFFGVSLDRSDEAHKRVADRYPGYRYFWDFDAKISKLYGAVAKNATGEQVDVHRVWIILDPALRVRAVVPFAPDRSDIAAVLQLVERLPPVAGYAGIEIAAPVLVLPDVFERELCCELIEFYEKGGGEESGFMREIDGKTVGVYDHSFKRRKDQEIDDENLIGRIRAQFVRRVVPMIQRCYQFNATRMERYIVACYAGEDRGYFRAHRDNTTAGTAHRRFAASVNLNDDFDGGDLYFPEYGTRAYKPPVGCAVVFSCSLLHAVSPVMRGRRYAFLPFLYDEDAARARSGAASGAEQRADEKAGRK